MHAVAYLDEVGVAVACRGGEAELEARCVLERRDGKGDRALASNGDRRGGRGHGLDELGVVSCYWCAWRTPSDRESDAGKCCECVRKIVPSWSCRGVLVRRDCEGDCALASNRNAAEVGDMDWTSLV